MTAERYGAQVALIVRAIPEIAEEDGFGLKGGTAINLFVRNLPRLSVDIDLVYLPVGEREPSLDVVRAGLGRIAARLRKRVGAEVDEQASRDGTRLIVRAGRTMIKIEVNAVLRGTVFDAELRPVCEAVADRFGYAEMKVVSFPDLYAGKIAAALDRQHPRDLFDVRYLLANEGLTDDLSKAFLVYLISHPRPPHELLAPHFLDLDGAYYGEFAGMTVEPVSLDALIDARARLVTEIGQRTRLAGPRGFLRSFYAAEPDWSLLELEADVAALPAVRWKLLNLEKLAAEQPAKFAAQARSLDACLDGAET